MTFFTRPNFSDNQIRQLSGDSITLSGSTDFAGTLKSRGIEIDASTGGTGNTGYVLTLDTGGTITLQQNAAAGTGAYDGNRTITQSATQPLSAVGIGGTTVDAFLDSYFFPDVPPNAVVVLFSGATTRQFGDGTDTATGGDVLNWQAIEKTNPIIISGITVNGISYDPDIDGDTTGTTSYVVTGDTATTGNTQVNQTYAMNVLTATEGSSSNVKISWNHKVFWFSASTKYLTGDDILVENILNTGVTIGNILATTRIRVFPTILFSDAYFYYVYPKQFGLPSFTVNGLPNNAWGTLPINLFEMSYTNTNGYTDTFYVASSDNKLDNNFEINCN